MFLFCIRIRALYAQILEKDAVIKILNQRLHQDQGRKDEQSPRTNLLNTAGAPLRLASSTPSIFTTNSTTKSRGEERNVALLLIIHVGRYSGKAAYLYTYITHSNTGFLLIKSF